MGYIVKATCRCRFEQTIKIGGGMRDFRENCTFPCFCNHCATLVVVNLMANNINCPLCNNDSLVSYMHSTVASVDGDRNIVSCKLFKDESFEEVTLDNGNYICPQCKSVSLRFSQVGMFD